MDNITVTVDKGILHLTVPLSKGEPSRSGKTLVCATTNGFQKIDGTEYALSLNVTKKK